jgi:hypothetical protein
LIAALCAQPAFAGFTVSGPAVQIGPPGDAGEGGTESDDVVFGWFESSGVLPVDVAVDHDGSVGVFDDFADATPTTLSAGKQYASYMFHFDPVGRPDDYTTVTNAVITFDNPIIGLLYKGPKVVDSLNATDDILGAPGTTYATGLDFRGIELRGRDEFAISNGGKVLTLSLVQALRRGIDEVRVLTAVPEMASVASWLFLAVGFAVAWRRKWFRR